MPALVQQPALVRVVVDVLHSFRVAGACGGNSRTTKRPQPRRVEVSVAQRRGGGGGRCHAQESNLSTREVGFTGQLASQRSWLDARGVGSGHTDTAFRQRCRNARRTTPPTSSAYAHPWRAQRKVRGSNSQGLAALQFSRLLPSPTVGLTFRTPRSTPRTTRYFPPVSQWPTAGAVVRNWGGLTASAEGAGDDPARALRLAGLANRCRRRLSASPSKVGEVRLPRRGIELLPLVDSQGLEP